MSRLSVNFTEPPSRDRRGPLSSLAHAIVLGTCLGGLASVALHLIGLI